MADSFIYIVGSDDIVVMSNLRNIYIIPMGNQNTADPKGPQENQVGVSIYKRDPEEIKKKMQKYSRYVCHIQISNDPVGKGCIIYAIGTKVLILSCLHCCAQTSDIANSKYRVKEKGRYEKLTILSNSNKKIQFRNAKIFSLNKKSLDLVLLIADRPEDQSYGTIYIQDAQLPNNPQIALPELSGEGYLIRQASIQRDNQDTFLSYSKPIQPSTSSGMSGSPGFLIADQIKLLFVHARTNYGIALARDEIDWIDEQKKKLQEEEMKHTFMNTASNIVQYMYAHHIAEIGGVFPQLRKEQDEPDVRRILKELIKNGDALLIHRILKELITNGDALLIKNVYLRDKEMGLQTAQLLSQFKSLRKINLNNSLMNSKILEIILKLPELKELSVQKNHFCLNQCLEVIVELHQQNLAKSTNFMINLQRLILGDLMGNQNQIRKHSIVYNLCQCLPKLEELSIGYKHQKLKQVIKDDYKYWDEKFGEDLGEREIRVHTIQCVKKKTSGLATLENELSKFETGIRYLKPSQSKNLRQYSSYPEKQQQYMQLLLENTQESLISSIVKLSDTERIGFFKTKLELQVQSKTNMLIAILDYYRNQANHGPNISNDCCLQIPLIKLTPK